MTIRQAIDKTDQLKPNQVSDAEKVAWLDALDRMVWDDVVMTHERPDGAPESFDGYNCTTDTETELLITEPHSQAYVYWLMANIDIVNQETAKYQNDYILYNQWYQSFADWYNRRHMPIGAAWKF